MPRTSTIPALRSPRQPETTGTGSSSPAASRYVTAVGGTTLSLGPTAAISAKRPGARAGSGCSLYIQKPAWQTDTGCARRTVADVSADADPNTGAAVYDTVPTAARPAGSRSAAPASPRRCRSDLRARGKHGCCPGRLGPVRTQFVPPRRHLGVERGLPDGLLLQGGPGLDGPTGLGTPNGIGAFDPARPPSAGSGLLARHAPRQPDRRARREHDLLGRIGRLRRLLRDRRALGYRAPVRSVGRLRAGLARHEQFGSTLTISTTGASRPRELPVQRSRHERHARSLGRRDPGRPGRASRRRLRLGARRGAEGDGRRGPTTYTVIVSASGGFSGNVDLVPSGSRPDRPRALTRRPLRQLARP